GTERVLRYQDLAALREGDYFSDGKLHDCDGKEIPVVESAHGAVDPRPVLAKSSEHV
ncbi:MAG: purine permease, partial [Kiritimatiellia bacterium]